MDSPGPRSSTKALSAEKFLQAICDSGLLSPAEMAALEPTLTAEHRKDGAAVAQELVQRQVLTKYQATMLLQGKPRGLVLGNYAILDKIGQGGMGLVFKAQHRMLKRIVALKVLPPAVTKNENAVKRFRREVVVASRLSHPNIVAAHDADEDKGVHYFVMEYVEGLDLSRLVKQQGPLPIAQAVDCIRQAALGLLHAHEAGIIHRDIKPHNLLLTQANGTSVVKILDMGLARMDDARNPGATATELTQSGSIMGTCDYMSPEQAMNTKKADQRADIYSLGCTLYYLLTGSVMYGGDTTMEKLMAHQTQPIPPLRSLRPEVSDELDELYQRMVAKKVDDRFQSMTELIAALETCNLESGVTAAVTTKRPALKKKRTAADTDSIEQTQGDDRTQAFRETPAKGGRRGLLAGGIAATCLALVVVGVGAVAFLSVGRKAPDRPVDPPTPIPQKPSGPIFTSLLKGKDLDGWRQLNPKRTTGTASVVQEDGRPALRMTSAMGLSPRAPFENYHLRFEYKTEPNAGGGIHHVMRDGYSLSFRLFRLFEEKGTTYGSSGPADVSYQEGRVEGGQVTGVGPRLTKGTQIQFNNVVRDPSSPWQRIEILRLDNSFVYIVNGKVCGALANVQTPAGKPDTGRTTIEFWTDSGPALFRNIEIREINALPPEIGGDGDTDLLKLIDPQKHAVKGEWRFDQGKLVSPQEPQARLQVPQAPPDEYEIEAVATRVQGNDGLSIGLVAGDRQVLVSLDGFGSTLSALDSLDGKRMHENETTYRGTILAVGKPTRISCAVKRDGIVVRCDGKNVIDWRGDRKRLSIPAHWAIPDKNLLLVGATNTTFHISKLTLRPLQPTPVDDAWLKQVRAMPPQKQVEAVAAKLKELNPGYDGKFGHRIENGVVVHFSFAGHAVSDLSPVRALSGLHLLWCGSVFGRNAPLSDLSPLKGLKLRELNCGYTPVRDLSPLEGMPLVRLRGERTSIADLTPLRGSALEWVSLEYTPVTDLSPLKGLPLKHVNCAHSRVNDVSPIASPPLESLAAPEHAIRAAAAQLQKVATLREINGKPAAEVLAALGPVSDVDLLKLIDPKKHASLNGEWRFDGQTLVTPAETHGRVRIPFTPPDEYEVEMTAEASEADAIFAVGLIMAGRQFAVLHHDVSGIDLLDSKSFRDPGNPSTHRERVLTPGKPTTIVYRIQKDRVSAHVGDKVIIDWRGEAKLLSLHGAWQIAEKNQLFLGHQRRGTVRISKLVLRPLPVAAVDEAWIKSVQAMPAEKQVEAVAEKLKELNPGFDGQTEHRIKDGAVDQLSLLTEKVSNISPVAALNRLTSLQLGLQGKSSRLKDLSPLRGMQLTNLGLFNCPVADFGPLRGMPLKQLGAPNCKVTDVEPLAGMPLLRLYLGNAPLTDISPLRSLAGKKVAIIEVTGTKVSDLSPLKGISLETLWCERSNVTDLSPVQTMGVRNLRCGFNPWRDTDVLKSVKTLEKINDKPVAEFWKEVDGRRKEFDDWVKSVQTMSAEKQVEAVLARLMEFNPGLDTKPAVLVHNGTVVRWDVRNNIKLRDLSPLRAFPALKEVGFSRTPVGDLSALRGMPLTSLDCNFTKVSDLSPLKDMPLQVLLCRDTEVKDLTPLRGMPLKHLICDFNAERDAEVLRSIKTLERINEKPVAEFWKDADKPGEVRQWRMPGSGQVDAVAVSPDGRLVASAHFDKVIRVRELESGKEVHSIPGHTAAIHSLRFSNDSKWLLSGGYNPEIRLRLWDMKDGKELRVFDGYVGAFSPDNQRIFSGSLNGALNLWDINNKRLFSSSAGKTGAVRSVEFFPDADRAASGHGDDMDSSIRIWDLKTGTVLHRLAGHGKGTIVNRMALTPNGDALLSCSIQDANAILWDCKTGAVVRRFPHAEDTLWGCAIARDGKRALTCSKKGYVRLFDLDSGKELHRFEGHSGEVFQVAFTPDGRYAVSAGRDGTLRQWRLPVQGTPPEQE